MGRRPGRPSAGLEPAGGQPFLETSRRARGISERTYGDTAEKLPPPEQRGFEVLEFDVRDPVTKQSLWTSYHCSPQAVTYDPSRIPRELYPVVYRPLKHYVVLVGKKYELYLKVKTNTRDEVRVGGNGALFSGFISDSIPINPGITEISIICEMWREEGRLYTKCERGSSVHVGYTIYFWQDPPGGITWDEYLMGNDGKPHKSPSREDTNTGHVIAYNGSLNRILSGLMVDPKHITYKNSISFNIRFSPAEGRNTCPPYFQPIGSW